MSHVPFARAHALSVASHRALALALLGLALGLVLTARPARPEGTKADIPTPVGHISAKSKGPPAHVMGIPEFPDARATHGDPDGDGAQASLDLPVLGMKMMALRFETHASQAQVLAFYRDKLGPLGKLSESDHGPQTDFGDFHWKETPGQRTLAVETDHRVYMVATKPLGRGCQFALVALRFEEK